MQKLLLTSTLFLTTLLSLASCGLDCIDKKTGMRKSSQTLKEAKQNEVFRFEFAADKSAFKLDSGLAFNINNAWVENDWKYECIDNKAVVVKDSSYQVVIDADYEGEAFKSNYWLGNSHLGTMLRFNYSGQDTFTLPLYKDTSYTLTRNKVTIDTITFVRQRVSR